MGVSTLGLVKQEITAKNILTFVEALGKVTDFKANSVNGIKASFIKFEYKGEERELQITEVEEQGSQDPQDEDNTLTFLTLGHWGESVEIMEAITSHFDGWYIENDEYGYTDEDWIKG